MNFLELLQQNIIGDVFDFKIEELVPEDETTPNNVPSISNTDDSNSNILEYIIQLEEQATNLTNAIHNLKQMIIQKQSKEDSSKE